jgi:hypothetical protein
MGERITQKPETLTALCARTYNIGIAPKMGNTPTTSQTPTGYRTDDHK